MVTQQRIADELKHEREQLTAYLRALPDGAWDKDSLCEGWTIHDVMAHAIGIASDVANRRLDGVGSPEQNQRQVDERKDRSPKELLDEWDDQGTLLEQGILELDDQFWNAPYSPGFNVGQALQRMVEDIWVHAHDVRLPLGDDPFGGPGLQSTLEVAAREWENRLPTHAPTVGSLDVQTGDFTASAPGAGDTAVKVTGDAVTLALVSTGRIPLDTAIADGKLSVEPKPDGLAAALNIYAP
ncbi:MAG TPA: maleylpyruvate isomerase family mycothiol-dependent enzyme [Actinomycetota bacterium]|nr:maleylpyruvate isomerase family mycothiol-dependent enzyme [Actinomycetota bacterium]